MIRAYLLGTGGAGSYEKRGPPAYLVETSESLILVDAGYGVDAKLRDLGIRVCDIDAIFLSHEHFDHLLGITGVLNMQVEESCTRSLRVYGPGPAVEAIPLIVEKTGPRNAPRPELIGLDPGITSRVELKDVIVEAVPVDHSVPSLGYIVESGGLRIVYSADTRPTNTIRAASRGAQLLLHEASMPSNMMDVALRTKHTTVREAVEVGREAELLVLIHIMHVAEEEARKTTGRRIIVPVDGMIITIG